ncbi:hypothetical protein B0H13DRAFT_2345657 [Mycena leptocephala]|nr:hypothetical protein B0H13DRAFT_2345657 [Mycena leptocephala]
MRVRASLLVNLTTALLAPARPDDSDGLAPGRSSGRAPERTLHAGVFFNMISYGVFVGDGWSFHAARVPVRTPLPTCCDVAGLTMQCRDGAWVRYFVRIQSRIWPGRRDTETRTPQVFYLFVVETLNTGFDVAMMYQPLVLQYAGPLSAALKISLTASPPHRPVKQFATRPRLHRSALVWFLVSCAVWGGRADGLIAGRGGRVDGGLWWAMGFVATDSVIDRIIRSASRPPFLFTSSLSPSIHLSRPLPRSCSLYLSIPPPLDSAVLTRFTSDDPDGARNVSIFSVFDVICFMMFPRYAMAPTEAKAKLARASSAPHFLLHWSTPLPTPHLLRSLARASSAPTSPSPPPPTLSPSLLLPTLPSFFPRLLAPLPYPPLLALWLIENFLPDLPLSKLYSTALLHTQCACAPRARGDGGVYRVWCAFWLHAPRGRSGWSRWSRGVGGVGHGLVFEDMALVEGTTKGGEGETEGETMNGTEGDGHGEGHGDWEFCGV